MSKQKTKVCPKCGKKEKINDLGFTNFSLHFPYCLECINRFMERLDKVSNGAKA